MILVRHGESTYIEEYLKRKAERKALGIVESELSSEEVAMRELEHAKHSLQSEWIDAPLTDLGFAESKKAADKIQSKLGKEANYYHKVYVSPLKRAI